MDTQHGQVKDVQFGDEASPKSSVPLLQSLIGDRNITRSFVSSVVLVKGGVGEPLRLI